MNKVIEKIVEKEVEKIVYVDKIVEVEKVVYRDRVVEKIIYIDKATGEKVPEEQVSASIAEKAPTTSNPVSTHSKMQPSRAAKKH